MVPAVVTSPPGDRGATRPPLIPGLVVAAFLTVVALVVIARHPVPFEDAAMLLRYAEHLAAGHGIVWNLGDPPVDGATDFLYLLMVSGLTASGASADSAAIGLSLIAHLATVMLLYYGIPALYRVPWWWGASAAMYLGVGAGLVYTAAHFGTPVFAAFAAGAWYCALRYVERGDRSAAWTFAVLSLLTALARPDGLVLVAGMVGGLAVRRSAVRPIVGLTVVFGTIGLSYFAWHWWYFGAPLPNPFYRKVAAFPNWNGALEGARMIVRMAAPAVATFLLVGSSRDAWRRGLMVAVPVAIYLATWILISTDMNHMARYQYALVPMLLLSAPGIVHATLRALPPFATPPSASVRRTGVVVLCGLALAVTWHHYRSFGRLGLPPDGRATVGQALRAFEGRGYTLVTTEAGLLPYYSKWRSIDAWGFNDRHIAQAGGLTESYLARQRPDVLMLLSDTVGDRSAEAEATSLQELLMRFATTHGYVLAAMWGGSPTRTHRYYVRPANPDCARLVRAIAGPGYRWFQSGALATNFATLNVGDACPTAGAP